MDKTRNAASRVGVLILVWLSILPAVFAQAAAPDRALAAKVDEYVNAAMKVRRFGGAILIARNGRGYGEDHVRSRPGLL